MTFRSSDMQRYFADWSRREFAKTIRKLRQEDWEQQVLDVNPDIDPYYDAPRRVEPQPIQVTDEMREWLKLWREIDEYERNYANGWTY